MADTFLNPSYWAELCPWLHVGGKLVHAAAAAGDAPPVMDPIPGESMQADSTLKAQMNHQGFVRITAGQLWGADRPGMRTLFNNLARGVLTLAEHGHSASCILAYDEAWLVSHLVSGIISDMTCGNVALGDFYVFNVQAAANDPSVQSRGWPPHRDRPMGNPDNIAKSFHADGSPRYVTCWVPLTDATPEASCMYFVPRQFDPGFLRGDAPNSDPLAAVIQSPSDYQRIIALPVPRGSLLTFSHRTLHWGSAPLAPAPGQEPPPPRIALSFAFSHPDYEKPYLRADRMGEWMPYPPHHVRMSLVAAQGLNYHHQAPLTAETAQLFAEVFSSHQDCFVAEYVDKTMSTAQWTKFSTAFKEKEGAGGGLGLTGAPSAEEVNLLFAAYAAAENGMDAGAYLS